MPVPAEYSMWGDREPLHDFLLPMMCLVILVYAVKILLRVEISITLSPRARCYTVRFGGNRGRPAEH
jgi:hypothetical protein